MTDAGAVEELVRDDSPVQRVSRIAYEAAMIGDRVIPEGSPVAALGGANRDPLHFSELDRLDVTRKDHCHLGFGWGIRFCPGAPLARLEGQIAISTILRRLPRLALAEERVDRAALALLKGATTFALGLDLDAARAHGVPVRRSTT